MYDSETLEYRDERREAVLAVLARRKPERMVYAPNYWQWFAHQRNHRWLPPEIEHCRSQLDLINHLGLDVFSRNVYCDEQRGWFGGLAEEVWEGVEVSTEERREGMDLAIRKCYRTRQGTLQEEQRYVWKESTLVQEVYALNEPELQLDVLEELVRGRRWRFNRARYEAVAAEAGTAGVVVAGELYSPLKMLHLLAGPAATTYLLTDHAERMSALMARHEAAQLALAREMAEAGVKVMMAMDNLDTALHPPAYVERCSASFYEKASRICHEHGSLFFIHACGKQRANLQLIDSLGVDGLEGVAFPPLGDVELEEALRMTSDRFIITGGISAFQTQKLEREQVFEYVGNLLERLKPYTHRFMLAASCNTAIETRYGTIKDFCDAWRKIFKNF